MIKQIRYTASGRLGLWDSLPQPEAFRSRLSRLLVANSHAVVEYDDSNPVETVNPGLAAVTAVCDKIIARGNPTWVAPDYEKLLLTETGEEFFKVRELADEPDVGFRFVGADLSAVSISELPDAALDLLDLPYSTDRSVPEQALPDEPRQLGSAEEEAFYSNLLAMLGPWAAGFIQRQALISDLVDGELPPGMMGNRVDFALQMSRVRWVFEVDGAQHAHERDQDARRDRTLQQAGWKVFRVPAATVRSNPIDWLTMILSRADGEEKRSLDAKNTWGSVSSALEHSPVHRAAWHTILMPLAVQRCLRGLLMLYRHGALDTNRAQRLLVVEEDAPAVVDAFHALLELWESIHALEPELGERPPRFSLDVIGPEGLSGGSGR